MNIVLTYIKYLFHYLKVTVFAFAINLLLYIFLKPNLGINLSSFISEVSGTFVLYTLLRITRKPKIKKLIFGISLQYLISSITIAINIISINIIYFFYTNYLINKSIFSGLSETYISFLAKFTASAIGLIFSSSMTIKFGFNFGKNE